MAGGHLAKLLGAKRPPEGKLGRRPGRSPLPRSNESRRLSRVGGMVWEVFLGPHLISDWLVGRESYGCLVRGPITKGKRVGTRMSALLGLEIKKKK